MDCRKTESLLLAERDGVLTTDQHAALASHVADCAACREFRAALVESALFLKTETANIAVPDIDQEWQAVRGQLAGTRNAARRTPKRQLAPIVWLSAPIAAAAALAIIFLNPSNATDSSTQIAAAGEAASTMVYVDKESGWLVVWASDKG
ncbi:anti-sigma factor family protein [Oleiharenicola lentus]|uniref:anti-sigma factor family protein n=1 Tax=Oleiharenicola lentus TaxID=2508720 RepID=UPI003F6815FB